MSKQVFVEADSQFDMQMTVSICLHINAELAHAEYFATIIISLAGNDHLCEAHHYVDIKR
jgi:hypothetical protein